MAFKLVVLACVAAMARAQVAVSPVGAPVAVVEEDYPSYKYGYDVRDGVTGDIKSQQERRDGEFVSGYYAFLDSDGTTRIVDYTAGPGGFNAVVRREPGLEPVAPVVEEVVPARPPPRAVLEPLPPPRFAAPVVAEPVIQRYAGPRFAEIAAPRFAEIAGPRFAEFAGPVFQRFGNAPVAYAGPAVASAYSYAPAYAPAAFPPPVTRFAPAPALALPQPEVVRAAPAKVIAAGNVEGYRYP
ncbi:cuticle protein 19.8 [Plutella xylostella]|uniref:cuticle protein 19.8 n=1 Tax=Plutella xylostella TaxID=51655 RepID=UPI002032FC6D|nr:cuticle protein 19.8 [Plutella xylostella]